VPKGDFDALRQAECNFYGWVLFYFLIEKSDR
jgi:hypothetical protein